MDSDNKLKDVGLKVTHPRSKILEILHTNSKSHLSADDIHNLLVKSNESIGLATVYRVLSQFESAGIVTRHNFEEGHSVYEMTQDHHHDHMVCVDTGKTIEFHDPEIEKKQDDIAASHGYEIVERSSVIFVKKTD